MSRFYGSLCITHSERKERPKNTTEKVDRQHHGLHWDELRGDTKTPDINSVPNSPPTTG